MVATRRGTRVDAQEGGERSAGEQTTEEVNSPPSPRKTRSSVKADGQTSEYSTDEGKSVTKSRSPLKLDTMKHSPQITTRSRHRSGQSDTNVSEAESCASNTSTRRTRSRQSLGQVVESTIKLRSRSSALITEPIAESKEDTELSETESNCSSVSTTRRRPPRSANRSVSTRSRRSILPLEPTSEVSDAESICSFSGEKKVATRSTRNSRARSQSTRISESQKEQTSDAESFTSGFSEQPLSRRISRRNKSNLQSAEMEFANETERDTAQDQETLKKQSPKRHGVKSDALSTVKEHTVLSSPRRSSRNQPEIQKDDPIVISDNDEPDSSDTVCKDLVVEKPEAESEETKVVETSAIESLQSSKSQPEENITPDPILVLSDDSMDSESFIEKSHVTKNSDVAEETNENAQNVQGNSDVVQDVNTCLTIDSDGSETSVQGDENHSEDENIMEVDEDRVVQKEKSKKASTKQLQDEGGLFVIDKAPGVVSSKKFFLEPDDDDDDDSGDDDDDDTGDDEDDIGDDETDDDADDFTERLKSKKASKQQLQESAGDGLFVIDTTPELDSSKKYFLEAEDDNKQNEKEVGRKEVPEPDEDDVDEDDDFIDEAADDEDEEETLLNKPRKGLVLSTSIDTGINLKKMGGLYINFDAEKSKPGPSSLSKLKKGNKKTDELLNKSIITPDFEKKESVPPYNESKHRLKKLHKMEREKTTGRGWFDMKAPELTEDLKNDLKALKMRAAMDPKHFYKKNDREGFPKYFEVGTVVDSPIDFYHSRIPKKERKRTIMEELLADSEFRRYNKKKYKEIIDEKAARAAGKKNRKKKKFRT